MVYYQENLITIYLGDAREILPSLPVTAIVISDPPYNVGYHYRSYSDSLDEIAYQHLLVTTFRQPSVMLHYPEAIVQFAMKAQQTPQRCAGWIYHANTPHQWRMIAWFGCEPDFKLMRQPYKNPTDSRVRELMERGSKGAALYDWWQIEQVKNVSDEKIDHPCQIPTEVMLNIVGITPCELIIDPFMGSGTTLLAAKQLGRKAIGIEMDEHYCEMAVKRLEQEYLSFELKNEVVSPQPKFSLYD